MRDFALTDLIKTCAAFTIVLALGACNMNGLTSSSAAGISPSAQQVVAIKNALEATDAAVAQQTVPPIIGTGYATISAQPAHNVNQKRLMAIRVARLDAMRDITEQVHGLRLSSQTTVIDAILQNDTTRAAVDGTIRGARTVRINPVGRDTYEVVLELDRDMIERLLLAVR